MYHWRLEYPSGMDEAQADAVEKAVAKVAKMTDDNRHNEARMYIATFLGNRKFEGIFKTIAQLHRDIGYMPHTLIAFRDEMTNDMMAAVEQSSGKDVRAKFWSAL